ncbi:hypothetical protein [Mycobacterium sp. OTB74]|jgi:hypothetical protein|uniref:hypothetical protein n=1 Tax=Mycobacterium sp. OTB74 TaxID=1853452 RepID=UPI00247674FB|nr:hypothetical protein [Mycobacterium sp. OTB74]MDH6246659.1 hypothetical protein [Mycobacterium sp. OTB74]
MPSYIHEFPHPRLVLCYDHPPEFGPDLLRWYSWAMDHGVSCLELHLRWRAQDRAVVSAHDDAQVSGASPTFTEVMNLILARKGDKPTVYADGKQFFVVLEIMDPSDPVADNLFPLLQQFQDHLSTAVHRGGAPRPVTFLLSGRTDQFYGRFKDAGLDSLAIKEDLHYADGQIVNLSDPPVPFRWTLFHHDDGAENGQVNARHHDPQANVRIWYHSDNLGDDDIRAILSTGTDAQNTRHDDLEATLRVLGDQHPRGSSPALAVRGSAALITWASAHKNLYAATGRLGPVRLEFTRQINLTAFLSGTSRDPLPRRGRSPTPANTG